MYTDKMLRDDALKGKTIVVTGGGSGLGKSMTKYFLQLGAQVAISSRNLDKLKATAKELEEETGGIVLPVQCDPLFGAQGFGVLAMVHLYPPFHLLYRHRRARVQPARRRFTGRRPWPAG